MIISKQEARLKHWYRTIDGRLHGTVYNHPRIPDGKRVTTSPVVKFNVDMTGAETINTFYFLTEPDEKEQELIDSEKRLS